MKDFFLALLWLAAGILPSSGAIEPIPGELKRWHKITVDFQGPMTSETATPNPFTDYRLNVTFTHTASGKTFLVPGYYAADGDAANTSASAGDVWRVHFAPDEVGAWTFTASFRTGADVATDDAADAGQSAGYFDGEGGGFLVDPTDKTGRDFRGKGRLEYVGKHHLRFAGTGEYFMKQGTDSPENLLAYLDFDGGFKTDGDGDEYLKDWAPHIQDWREGDPVWQGTKGKGLIGAVNYLASEGLNAFSFLTMNINGDDENVFPYIDNNDLERLDVSRLAQWEIVFEHGTRMGMFLHFKTQETENERLLDSGNVGTKRKLYYRELIARFSHNLALNWNLGEEINDASTSQKKAWAKYFHDHDPYGHPIVIHNGDSHFDLMGEEFDLTGMSLQFNEPDFSDTFFQTRRYVKRSADFNKPWVVAADEPGNSSTSLQPDDDPADSHVDARKNAIWGNILAGGAGCEFYFGYLFPNSDLTCNDFRSRDLFWDYCRHALELFEDHDFPFQLMQNHNDLVSGSGDNANRCLAKIGDTYLVQLHDGGDHTLDLTAATGGFSTGWFNPRTGGPLIEGPMLTGGGIVSLGSPPDSPGEDWIVLVTSTDGGSGTNSPPVVDAGPDRSAFLVDGEVSVDFEASVTDDGLPDEFALTRTWSVVDGPAAVVFSNPSSAITTATFTDVGEYTLHLAASDSDLSTADDVLVTVYAAVAGNNPPEFGGYLLATPVNQPVMVPVARVITGATDSDGDTPALSIASGGTAAGGYVTIGPDSLTYTPSIDYSGDDSFILTVEDGRGGFVQAPLQINVVLSDGIEGRVPVLGILPDGRAKFALQGVPGFQYGVERSTDLTGWNRLGTAGAGPDGQVEFIDPDPPEGRAFYRWVSP